MNEIKIKALVIRTVDVGETDKLLTLYTEEKGKITASVRGSRSLKSRYFSAVQLCCYTNLVLARRNDRYYVKEADLIDNFFSIREDLGRTALAAYICEAIGYVATEEAPDIPLFRLALNTLFAISRATHPLPMIKAVFEWRAAGLLGFMPDLSACATCGRTEGDFFLDVMNGNLMCDACRKEENDAPKAIYMDEIRESRIICVLNTASRVAAEYVLHCQPERILSFRLEDEALRLFSIAGETYFLNQIEHGFQTLQFYKDIMRMK